MKLFHDDIFATFLTKILYIWLSDMFEMPDSYSQNKQ